MARHKFSVGSPWPILGRIKIYNVDRNGRWACRYCRRKFDHLAGIQAHEELCPARSVPVERRTVK